MRDVAERTGRNLRVVRSWCSRWSEWPPPIARIPSPGNPRIRINVYDESAVWECLSNHHQLVATRNMWSIEEIASALGIGREVVRDAYRCGALPASDGFRVGHPVWRPTSAQAWIEGRTIPERAWTSKKVTRHTGRSIEHCIRSGLIPDGRTKGTQRQVGTRWWWPETVEAWWANIQRAEFAADLNRQQELIRERELRAVKRWFSKDVAAHTGLAWDTVRTYRRRGVLPLPDGFDGNRPWWLPETILYWDQPKSTGRPRSAGTMPTPAS